MIKNIIPIVLSLFASMVFLFGCDKQRGSEVEQDAQYSFNYEIYDESGELLKKATREHVSGSEVKRSAGVFGRDFTSPKFLEEFPVKPDRLGPEHFRKHTIYLMTATGSSANLNRYHLRFTFPEMQQWENGVYRLLKRSKEDYLRFLRLRWQRRNKNHIPQENLQNYRSITEIDPIPGKRVEVSYSESGFIKGGENGIRTDDTMMLYWPTDGRVELEQVSDKHIRGKFTIEMLGYSMNLFPSDEFPDDSEFQMFRMTGNFTVLYGDYTDLELSADKLLQN